MIAARAPWLAAMLAAAIAPCIVVAAASAAEAADAAGATQAQREIAALIRAIATSSCRFERNGSWYDAATAGAHLQRKYDALRERAPTATAEQFIQRAASRSSVSGKPYHVRCGESPAIDASAWFAQALQRLRAKSPSPATR